MRTLEAGGNAFDAATAGALTMQVVGPHLNGPAGDVSILIYSADERRVRSICGQGPTPAAATIETFEAHGLDLVPGTGLMAAVVPGAFDAWMLLLRDYGTCSLEDVIAPAIEYAQGGFPVLSRMRATLDSARPIFERYWPTSADIYLPGGKVPVEGALFANPRLAATWRRLVAETSGQTSKGRESRIDAARKVWSRGFIAQAIDSFCRHTRAMDISGQENGALLCGEDLAKWSAFYEEPTTYDYKGHRVAKCGPWSQGPVLLQSLAILSGTDVACVSPEGADFVHLLVEAMKLAYADRDTYYGDPDHADVPLDQLLSPSYNELRRDLIEPIASHDWRPGATGMAVPEVDFAGATARKREGGALAAYGGGEPTFASIERGNYLAATVGDTAHIDVVDRFGNMVSATPSGGWLQSSPCVSELGFPLGTRAQMMWLTSKTSPSAMGPGRRPRTTLSPTIVLRDDGEAYLACGTPGGDQQDQWQLAFLLRCLDYNMGMQEAIEAPAFHSEHWPSSFYPRQVSPGALTVEGRFAPETIRDLEARGHKVTVGGDWSEGRLSAVARGVDKTVRAAASPRGMDGYAVGR